MSKIFRVFSTAPIFLVAIIATLTIEVASEEMGYLDFIKSIISSGVHSLSISEYESLIIAAFYVSLGMFIAVWLDYLIRKLIAYLKKDFAEILAWRNDEDREVYRLSTTGSVEGWHIRSVTMAYTDLLLVYGKDMPDVALVVTSDCKGLEWCELSTSDRHASVRIKWSGGAGDVRFRAESTSGRIAQRRLPEMEYQSVEFVPKA